MVSKIEVCDALILNIRLRDLKVKPHKALKGITPIASQSSLNGSEIIAIRTYLSDSFCY